MRKTQGDFSPSTCRFRVKPKCDASRGLKAGKDLMTPHYPPHPSTPLWGTRNVCSAQAVLLESPRIRFCPVSAATARLFLGFNSAMCV